MEASVTDQGEQQVQGGEGGGEAAAAPGPDLSPLMDRFEQFTQDVTGRLDGLEQQRQQAPEAGAEEEGGEDGSWDELLNADDLSPEQAQAALDSMIEKRASGLVAPLQERLDRMDLEREAADLEEEFPELMDEAKAEQAVKAARQQAAQMGNPDLAGRPSFIGLVYKASKADQIAASEVPADGGGHVQLEGGGGAAPPASEEDVRKGIVQAGGGNGFWTG